MYVEWLISRQKTDEEIPTPEEVKAKIDKEREATDEERSKRAAEGSRNQYPSPGPFETEVYEKGREALLMGVPMRRTIDILWAIEGPVSLREQLVRHMMGHRFGGSFGVDHIPELENSAFWIQSMRQKDMSKFADDGGYYMPPTAEETNSDIIYAEAMQFLQHTYSKLRRNGMPEEDARNVLPFACTHRLTWKCNLEALFHVLSRRSCWVAQLGMWEPIIEGMREQLVARYGPAFQIMFAPPCIDKNSDKFKWCPVEKDNLAYMRGEDPHFPCPLWYHNTQGANRIPNATWEPAVTPNQMVHLSIRGIKIVPTTGHVTGNRDVDAFKYAERVDAYAKLWQHDPVTWGSFDDYAGRLESSGEWGIPEGMLMKQAPNGSRTNEPAKAIIGYGASNAPALPVPPPPERAAPSMAQGKAGIFDAIHGKDGPAPDWPVIERPAVEQESNNAKLCKRCGDPIAPTARFCGECGLRTDDMVVEESSGESGAGYTIFQMDEEVASKSPEAKPTPVHQWQCIHCATWSPSNVRICPNCRMTRTATARAKPL